MKRNQIIFLMGLCVLFFAASCTKNPKGGTEVDEPVVMTKGFASIVNGTGGNGTVRYRIILTNGSGTSSDDISGPGEILALEVITNDSAESVINPGIYSVSGTSSSTGTIVTGDGSRFGTVDESGVRSMEDVTGGSLTFGLSEGIYTIKGTLDYGNEDQVEIEYSGPVDFAEKPAFVLGKSFASYVQDEAEGLERYSVTLTNGNGDDVNNITGPGEIFTLELITANDSGINYISAGNYTVSDEALSGGTIIKGDATKFGTLDDSGERSMKPVIGGSINVEVSGEIYVIRGTLECEGGVWVKIFSSTEFTFAERPVSVLDKAFASYLNDEAEGAERYSVTLTNGNGTDANSITGPGEILTLELITANGNPGVNYISAGTYDVSNTSASAGTILAGNGTRFGTVNAAGERSMQPVTGGRLVIELSGEVYTISGTIDYGDDRIEIDYSGELVFTRRPLEEYTMTNIDVLYIGLSGGKNINQYVLKLMSADYDGNGRGSMLSLYMNGFKTYFYDGIAPATYTYTGNSGSTAKDVILDSSDSWFFVAGKNGGNNIPIKSGQIKVSKSGDVFTISGTVENQSVNEGFMFGYEGAMPMKKARFNLDYSYGKYYGNYFYSRDSEGELYGHKDVGQYDVVLSNLEFDGFAGPFYNGPGESVSFVFGGTYSDNGTVDPVNYNQEYIPNGTYTYGREVNSPESYKANKIWPYWGDWWNETQFITVNSDLSKTKMEDSNFTVTVGEKTSKGYKHTITGNVTTEDNVEIEFRFEGPIKFEPVGVTRPFSELAGDYSVKPLTQAYFEDLGEVGDGLYQGYLYLASSGADPLNWDPANGDIITLSMFRTDEDDFLPVGNNHFTMQWYDDKIPMSVHRAELDETWDSSWLQRPEPHTYVQLFEMNKFNISKAPGGIYTIQFEFLDDAFPGHKITGSYTGEVLDFWDETPINAPKVHPPMKLRERPSAAQGKARIDIAASARQ